MSVYHLHHNNLTLTLRIYLWWLFQIIWISWKSVIECSKMEGWQDFQSGVENKIRPSLHSWCGYWNPDSELCLLKKRELTSILGTKTRLSQISRVLGLKVLRGGTRGLFLTIRTVDNISTYLLRVQHLNNWCLKINWLKLEKYLQKNLKSNTLIRITCLHSRLWLL